MEKIETWKVTGCGVTAICSSREAVAYWMTEMVNRGGVPDVQRLAEAA